MLTKEDFAGHLRSCLNHLYDPDHLRQSPLAALFGVTDRMDTPSALQRILIDTIKSLEPAPDEPSQSPAWQLYELLFYRYVEQLSPLEVADQMAIGERHLRRKQRTALDVLVDLLWQKYNLEPVPRKIENAAAPVPQDETTNTVVSQELAWLNETDADNTANLCQLWPAILGLAEKVAARYAVKLQDTFAADLPVLMVRPIALRQILLSLLNVVIPRAAGGRVLISARPLLWEVVLHIRCSEYPSGQKPILSHETEALDMARQLADLSGCTLDLTVSEKTFAAQLNVPVLKQLTVLVIDDNPDALQMVERYTSGTRYHVIAIHDPENALAVADRTQPEIIVLDVMMPKIDGWDLLQQFRQHPPTAHKPIIVCTILAQQEFALLLGASGFLRKPLSRQAFLKALDQQADYLNGLPIA